MFIGKEGKFFSSLLTLVPPVYAPYNLLEALSTETLPYLVPALLGISVAWGVCTTPGHMCVKPLQGQVLLLLSLTCYNTFISAERFILSFSNGCCNF